MCFEQTTLPLNEHSNIEYNIVQNLLFEAKCLSPPDVYILEDKDSKCAFKKLALDDIVDPILYILEPISDIHQIVQCLVKKMKFIYLFLKLFFFLRFVAKVFFRTKKQNFFKKLGTFICRQIIIKNAK